MKKITLLILLFLSNCVSQKNSRIEQDKSVKELLANLKYDIKLPEHWVAYKDLHNDISFKPKVFKGLYPEVQINLKEINVRDLSLKEYANKGKTRDFLNAVSNYKKNNLELDSKYGKIFINTESFTLNAKSYITRLTYFEHDKKFYVLSYYANLDKFNKYLDDLVYIFNNIEFRL